MNLGKSTHLSVGMMKGKKTRNCSVSSNTDIMKSGCLACWLRNQPSRPGFDSWLRLLTPGPCQCRHWEMSERAVLIGPPGLVPGLFFYPVSDAPLHAVRK